MSNLTVYGSFIASRKTENILELYSVDRRISLSRLTVVILGLGSVGGLPGQFVLTPVFLNIPAVRVIPVVIMLDPADFDSLAWVVGFGRMRRVFRSGRLARVWRLLGIESSRVVAAMWSQRRWSGCYAEFTVMVFVIRD